MALVVGENTYVTINEARAIADADFIIKNLGLSDAALEISLINATMIVDDFFEYRCYKSDKAQLLKFPRTCTDEDSVETILDINYDIKLITTRICYYMKIDSSMFEKTTVTAGQVKKEKMDIFETEYFASNSESVIEFIDKLDEHTRKLLEKYTVFDTDNQIIEFRTK